MSLVDIPLAYIEIIISSTEVDRTLSCFFTTTGSAQQEAYNKGKDIITGVDLNGNQCMDWSEYVAYFTTTKISTTPATSTNKIISPGSGPATSSQSQSQGSICQNKCGQTGLKGKDGKTCHCDKQCVKYNACCDSVEITKKVCGY